MRRAAPAEFIAPDLFETAMEREKAVVVPEAS
jgi:hypothetical protein